MEAIDTHVYVPSSQTIYLQIFSNLE